MSMLKHAALLTQSSNTRPDSRMLVRATEPTPRSASFVPPLSLTIEERRLLQAQGATPASYFFFCAPSTSRSGTPSQWSFRWTFQGKAL